MLRPADPGGLRAPVPARPPAGGSAGSARPAAEGGGHRADAEIRGRMAPSKLCTTLAWTGRGPRQNKHNLILNACGLDNGVSRWKWARLPSRPAWCGEAGHGGDGWGGGAPATMTARGLVSHQTRRCCVWLNTFLLTKQVVVFNVWTGCCFFANCTSLPNVPPHIFQVAFRRPET